MDKDISSILSFNTSLDWLQGKKYTKDFPISPNTTTNEQTVLSTYQIACDEGFMRLYTMAAHRYWISQAQGGYLTPDWKIHFSIVKEDIPKAWQIISLIFVQKRCLSGMKVAIGPQRPKFQTGREITVYIYRYHNSYSSHKFYEGNTPLYISPQFEQNRTFWLDFIESVEHQLSVNHIKTTNGIAKGDKPLGKYSSYRNEAFIKKKPDLFRDMDEEELDFYNKHNKAYVYPPNKCGYNATGHLDPLFPHDNRSKLRSYLYCTVMIFLSVIIYLGIS